MAHGESPAEPDQPPSPDINIKCLEQTKNILDTQQNLRQRYGMSNPAKPIAIRELLPDSASNGAQSGDRKRHA